MCKSYAPEIASDYVCVWCVMLPETLSSIRLTQHDMLTQHQVNIRKSISDCFLKCDFSKEQCSSLKMILGSKAIGAILNVFNVNFYVCALVGVLIG